MSSDELELLAQRIYGVDAPWIGRLASDMGHHYMTVWKWLKGRLAIKTHDANHIMLLVWKAEILAAVQLLDEQGLP